MPQRESIMEEHEIEASPGVLSRIGGALYLIIIFIGILGEAVVRGRVVVPGDPAATAVNLQRMETLWRLGIAGELVLLVCAVTLTLILYVLLRPVNRDLALLAVFFNLISIAVEATAALNLAGALHRLGSGEHLTAFRPEQLHGLARLEIQMHSAGFGTALVFFGAECLVLGYLIVRSGYLPRVIGVLMAAAGASYLINSFAVILAPAFAARLFPAGLIPAFVGELSLAVWLLVKGVDVGRWQQRASRQSVRSTAASGAV